MLKSPGFVTAIHSYLRQESSGASAETAVPSCLVLYQHLLRIALEKADRLRNDEEPEEEKCSLLRIAQRVGSEASPVSRRQAQAVLAGMLRCQPTQRAGKERGYQGHVAVTMLKLPASRQRSRRSPPACPGLANASPKVTRQAAGDSQLPNLPVIQQHGSSASERHLSHSICNLIL